MKHNNTSRFLTAVLLLICAFQNTINAQCTLACNNQINLSLASDCNAEVTYDMMLEDANNPNTCSPTGSGFFFEVTVMSANGSTVLPTSPFVTDTEVGQTLDVKVRHLPSGNLCWGTVLVEDKLAPDLTCPADLSVACTAATDLSATGNATATDCSNFTLTNFDNTTDLGCGDPVEIIERTFLAIDENGWSSSCVQTISVENPDVNAVVFPLNLDNNESPALACEAVGQNAALTEPENTGFPTLDGLPIEEGANACGLNIGYNDNIIDVCDGTYKILRSWSVLEWCTSTIRNDIQIIKVEDDDGPTVVCQPVINAGTTGVQTCDASILLPAAQVSDACSGISQVQIFSQFGTVSGNGGLLSNVPTGTHTLTYQATDNCQNSATCVTTLTVADDDSPTVVCDEFTVVTLNQSGTALVNAETFDDGSYDNCCLDDFLVRRVNAGCGTGNNFAEQVAFCCEDIGQQVAVELQVSDCFGNENTCNVIATIEENTSPLISCPSTVTLSCTDDYTDLDLTGEPITFDACGTSSATFTDQINLNACNSGTVIRTFSTADNQGNGNSCQQTIILEDNTPFSVNFPPDYTAGACTAPEDLDPEDLPTQFAFPTYNNDDCEQLAVNFTDEFFQVAPPACFKIIRTWTVIDWCVFDAANPTGPGQFSAQQQIIAMDNEAPTVTCAPDFSVNTNAQNCVATVTWPQPTVDDCSMNTQVSISSPLGAGFGPFQNVAPGEYTATYFVSDGCGNTSTCTTTATVVQAGIPTPYCVAGLTLELSPIDNDGDGNPDEGEVEIWASDFDAGSFSSCGGAVSLSFSPDVTNDVLFFSCADVGVNQIFLYVTDQNGNQDFCETLVFIESVPNVCSDEIGGPFIIAGAIADENGNMLENAEVGVNDGITAPYITDENGHFQFDAMTAGADFTVSPELNTDPMNGVSTFDLVLMRRHVLNTILLDSPYKIIAADVNRNGAVTTADIVELRKLILTTYSELPNNTSWRFVDADYAFPDPENPFAQGFPEVYNINNLATDMMTTDFIAVKIGDVNGTAVANGLQNEESAERAQNSLIFSLEKQTLRAGESYVLPVTAESNTAVGSGQFTLAFAPEMIDFQQITPKGDAFASADFSLHAAADGYVTAAWYRDEAVKFSAENPVFYLHFTARQDAELREVFTLNSSKTRAAAYGAAGEVAQVALTYTDADIALRNYPNPFTESTTVVFNLTDAQGARLEVSDCEGRVFFVTEELRVGENRVVLSGGIFKRKGVYFCRVYFGGGSFGLRVVRV